MQSFPRLGVPIFTQNLGLDPVGDTSKRGTSPAFRSRGLARRRACRNPTVSALRRMRDTSRKNNVFAQFRKNERDKQKLIDTVAKQLRSLINSHHS